MFKKITPPFVLQFDQYLLANHPLIWMSRIHFVLWHGAVLLGISALLGLLMPIRLEGRIEYGLWYFLFTVIGVIILCFWIYHCVIFNKEKQYGKRSFSDEYKNFILTFTSVLIFLITPWPFQIIYNQRIANTYGNDEVMMDINTLNENSPYMVHYAAYLNWYDTTANTTWYNLRKLQPYNNNFFTPYYVQDSSEFPLLKTNLQLFKEYKPLSDINAVRQKVSAFFAVADKYGVTYHPSADEVAQKYLKLIKLEKVSASEISYSSYIGDLSNVFNNLCKAKFKTLDIFEKDALWILFYFVISSTSFLLLFKMNYWQQFLIMLVILILYPLLAFIFRELVVYSSRNDGAYESSLLALILFSGFSIFVTAREERCFRPFYNIFNQLFYITIIFSPLLLLLALHNGTNIFHNHGYDYVYSGNYEILPPNQHADYQKILQQQLWAAESSYWYNEYRRWTNMAQYGGILIYLVCLPLFKHLFVKQLALPKKN